MLETQAGPKPESSNEASPGQPVVGKSTAGGPTGAGSPGATPDLVRVQIAESDLTYETIKTAIYAQARYLSEKSRPLRKLLVSSDVYEILNRRLVFKTAAHKDLPHFITPFGNLRVQRMDSALDEPNSFIIEG